MRFHGVRVLRVLLLFALVVFLPGLTRADLAPAGIATTASDPLFSGIGLDGAGLGHCLVETAWEDETYFFSAPVARRYLSAVTGGFRKTKVHARRLFAQCRFPGVARVPEVSCFESGAAMALLPLKEGPHREKKPWGTRAPPLLL